jgi:hypothetical protein
MIFLAANQPCTLEVYDAFFALAPLTYPEVNPRHVLVMESELGRRILQRENKKIQPISFEAHRLPGFPKPLPPLGQLREASRVILIRGGGIGDVLMTTPAIRELRRRLPEGSRLTLATFRSNVPLFAKNPFLDAVTAEPMTLADFLGLDYFIEFNDPDHRISRMHMTDFYLSVLGIDPDTVEDKTPVLTSDALLAPEMARTLQKAGSPFKSTVYLNGLASDRLRDLPPKILEVFPGNNPDILFLVPASYDERYNGRCSRLLKLPNVLRVDTGESLPDYVTTIACCNAVVTTDSSAYHLAASQGKPSLALFGPIDPGLRTAYYPTVKALMAEYAGETCHSPCGKSMISEFKIPLHKLKAGCPEARKKRTGFSPCLASFSAESLLEAFEEIRKKLSPRDQKEKSLAKRMGIETG